MVSFFLGCSTSLARTGVSVERGRLLVSLPLSAKRAAERKFFKLLASACKLINNVTGGSSD